MGARPSSQMEPRGMDRCNETYAVAWRGSMYLPVNRKSVHVPLKGFGRETDRTGWFHFVDPGSEIFLKVDTVLDYTCPAWMMHDATAPETIMAPTGRHWKYNAGVGSFTRPLQLLCSEGRYCMPRDCTSRGFDDSPTLNAPAYWRWDPPVHHHHFKRYALTVALAFWAGHEQREAAKRECGKRILVDYRAYGTTDQTYFRPDGTLRPIACPENHRYHRIVNGTMVRCRCVMERERLNCA